MNSVLVVIAGLDVFPTKAYRNWTSSMHRQWVPGRWKIMFWVMRQSSSA